MSDLDHGDQVPAGAASGAARRPEGAAFGVNGDRPDRVTLVSQWFPPEPAALAQRLTTTLRHQGFVADVLTGVPNYPRGVVYEGYSARRRSVEVQDGARVLRTPLYPSHDRSAIGRAVNYTSWAASSSLLGASALRDTDVALVYSSPVTATAAAMMAKLRWRTPYVTMVIDLWPDNVFATGFLTEGPTRRIAEAVLGRFTDRTYRWADHVTVPTPGLRDIVIDRGVPAEKVSLVYIWADEKIMQPTEPEPGLRRRLGLTDDDFLLMYGGNLGAAQRLDVVVDAMARLRDTPDVHLVLVGDGVEKDRLIAQVTRDRLGNVHFLDSVPPERMPARMAVADLNLISLADEPLFRITLPSKTQSILACGQPMLACAPGDVARIARDAEAGFAAPPGDAEALAAVIRSARDTPRDRLRDMGRAGRQYYLTHMSEASNAPVLADLLATAARRGRIARARRRP
ncbi:glycosyltransferase family 4 protein [Micromonospora sp. ALFpr18c]|uniref:glycosyltransferase family 4 protein n=1 Tax=unclassified Micromonospora TaxID=2617518 RepID=UPI00124B1DEB|nr:glycosyltransferase family 4 protein [Micromonospora sp. ALFpr18c]KAB1940666.1 glycosyltransferase family 4 protein [Micromonospora sp. ALFpr18c]